MVANVAFLAALSEVLAGELALKLVGLEIHVLECLSQQRGKGMLDEIEVYQLDVFRSPAAGYRCAESKHHGHPGFHRHRTTVGNHGEHAEFHGRIGRHGFSG